MAWVRNNLDTDIAVIPKGCGNDRAVRIPPGEEKFIEGKIEELQVRGLEVHPFPARHPDAEKIFEIKNRKYECFIEDHTPKHWSEGQCAGYAGRGSLAMHLYRCKRRSGYGIGELFCKQHAKEEI